MNPIRWLYLDLNSYFASVEQQLNPELRGRPVAVGPEAVNSGTIIAASYEAKAFGVKTGMRVGDAKQLCPELVFTGSGHGRYVEFHEKILAEIWRHIPITHVCSIDEVACRLLDNENSPAQAMALAQRIKDGIRRNVGTCLTSSVGIAPSRLVAKIAADMQKPDGLTLIQSHDLPHALFKLSLRDIPGIGARMEARLNARGITTMAQLLGQDANTALSSWGSVVGARMWHELHGADLPQRARQSRSIGHSHVLAPQLRDMETARLTARRLLLKAASRLREAQCITRRLTLSARFEVSHDGRIQPQSNLGWSKTGWSATATLPPTDDSFPLLEALTHLWERLASEAPRQRIHSVGVSCEDIRPHGATAQQLDLFHPTARPSEEISRAMDAINAKFGRNAVTLGSVSTGRASLIGTKIAFGRIPKFSEFHQ